MFVTSSVRSWLRLEAVVVAVAGTMVWAGMSGGWARFALFILIPDISFIGYVWGPRAGATIYNVAHSYVLPMAIGLVGAALDQRALLLTGALWMTHIGIDRALGYGLKYGTAFQDTHLGRIGREPVPAAVQRTGEHLAALLTPSDSPHNYGR